MDGMAGRVSAQTLRRFDAGVRAPSQFVSALSLGFPRSPNVAPGERVFAILEPISEGRSAGSYKCRLISWKNQASGDKCREPRLFPSRGLDPTKGQEGSSLFYASRDPRHNASHCGPNCTE